ncbi:MAG: hypothetical protein A2048_01400 [Deltaproteobacteria bacterium GWA2_45_12]|nr:MAG: hypothetical protein A2048_01400 [Deltaproteobacteria bacterium GWA2_45_12]
MEIKFLKPAPGVKIRDPRTKEFLPIDGRRVEMTVYWNRRIQDGTVVAVENQMAFPKTEKLTIEKSPADKSTTDTSSKRGSDL